MNVLHITTHLGGGAGKAIAGIAIQGTQTKQHTHRIYLLETPEKLEYVEQCNHAGVSVKLLDDQAEWLAWADVLVINWWNHPAMISRLAYFIEQPCPTVIWVHTNSIRYPILPFGLAEAFDEVLVTSPCTLKNPDWTVSQQSILQKRTHVVYGMGDFSPSHITPKQNYTLKQKFTIGYVGTLNYGKIHPEIASYCSYVRGHIPNVQFIFVGDCDSQLEQDIKHANLEGCTLFTGYVSNVMDYMREFDVFGYLLQPDHYGTTENVLLEAMACGLPIIVRKQNVEQYIVPHQVGFQIETMEEYAEILKQLYNSEYLRQQMGLSARNYVINHYNASQNLDVFHQACGDAISHRYGSHACSFMGSTPWEWFLSFLTKQDRQNFEHIWKLLSSKHCTKEDRQKVICALQHCPPIFREKHKGSIQHFSDVYPEDPALDTLAQILKQE